MYDDEDVFDREQRQFDEPLERDGGVFVEGQRTQVDCNREPVACAPDEYPEDPLAIDNRPGTPDDLGYTYGVEVPNANDLHLVPEGRTGQRGSPAPDVERAGEPGERDEQDLWARQQPLIEEDERSGVKLPEGYSDEDAEQVMDAMGDGSAMDTSEDVAGRSATAEPTLPEDHGGFPERDD